MSLPGYSSSKRAAPAARGNTIALRNRRLA